MATIEISNPRLSGIRNIRFGLLLFCLFFGLNCSTSSTLPKHDTGHDLAIYDGPYDQNVDHAFDGAGDSLEEDYYLGTDATYDFKTTDAIRSATEVLYISTLDPLSFGLRRVLADGSDAPQLVAGFNGLIRFSDLQLVEPRPSSYRNPKQVFVEDFGPFNSLVIPNRGRLIYFHRTLSSTSGLLLIDKTLKLNVLFETPGLYDDVIFNMIAIRRDEIVAFISNDFSLHLISIDGQARFNGKTSERFGLPDGVHSLSAKSMRWVNDRLFILGKNDSGTVLLSAQVGQTEFVTHELKDNAQPLSYVRDDIIVSADQSTLVFVGGESASVLDVFKFDLNSNQFSKLAAEQGKIGTSEGAFGAQGRMFAISPSGASLGYYRNDTQELIFLSAQTSSRTNIHRLFVDQKIQYVASLYFLSDEKLLFMAGENYAQNDFYLFDVTTNTLTNLSGIGSSQTPFDGKGGFSPQSGFITNDWLYFIVYDTVRGTTDLIAISNDSSSPIYKRITTGYQLSQSTMHHLRCDMRHERYLVARSDPSFYNYQLFRLNEEYADLKQISHSGGRSIWHFGALMTDEDCSTLILSMGAYQSQFRLYRMMDFTSSSLQAINGIPKQIATPFGITKDKTTVVFASGGAADAMTLKSVLSGGSQELSLDPLGGYIYLLGVN